jgi:hypothetical protein
MADPEPPAPAKVPPPKPPDPREQRLADALRANLRRRKSVKEKPG